MKDKEYYTVTISALVPTILKYRVLADSPEEAAELAKKNGKMIDPPKQNIAGSKFLTAKVTKFGSSLIEFIKKWK